MAKQDKEAAAAEGGETTEAAKESKIAPKPDGFVSPYQFAQTLSQKLGREIRPQTIYAQVRNRPKLKDGTEFPVEKNSDGHYMINEEAALAWYDARDQEKAAAAAAKASKEEAATEDASE